jgi:hypothetical protein
MKTLVILATPWLESVLWPMNSAPRLPAPHFALPLAQSPFLGRAILTETEPLQYAPHFAHCPRRFQTHHQSGFL